MSEELPYWKLGCFLAYNALALTSMNLYVRRFVMSRKKSPVKQQKSMQTIKRQYSFGNALKKGSMYGVMMGGLYIGGLSLLVNNLMPLSAFKKLC